MFQAHRKKQADSLSWLQLQTFKQLAPAYMYMHEVPTVIPPLLQLLSCIRPIASFLLCSTLQPSATPTYQRAWRLFHPFFISTFQFPFGVMPISSSVLSLFIAYLFRSRYALSTVMTYVSALGYYYKLQGYSDPSKVFCLANASTRLAFAWIAIFLLHCQFQTFRFPISAFRGTFFSRFQAMCSLTFFAFLHIGGNDLHWVVQWEFSPPNFEDQ